MSGREPVAAFFPSIDRSLMAELDRHLRAPTPRPAPEPAETQKQMMPTTRPDIEGVVEAVEQAASSIAAMTQRIQDLEAHNASLEDKNRELSQQLTMMLQRHQSAEANARAHSLRADEAESLAAQHSARAEELERDLGVALADLNRVTDAIANALGLPAPG